MNDEGNRIAWSALKKGIAVFASDGTEIGKISVVIADEQKDIFSGVEFKHGLLGSHHFAAADLIDELTTDGVKLKIDSEAASRLGPRS